MRVYVFLIVCALIAVSPVARAQRVAAPSASDVKAAYLYQFGQYVEWPTPADALALCVAGDDIVASALEKLARDDGGSTKVVVYRDPPTPSADCRILYIGRDAAQSRGWLKALNGRATLAVGDDVTFLRDGGMVAFILQDKKLRFSVNLISAEAAHLRLSSQLLRHAVEVLR